MSRTVYLDSNGVDYLCIGEDCETCGDTSCPEYGSKVKLKTWKYEFTVPTTEGFEPFKPGKCYMCPLCYTESYMDEDGGGDVDYCTVLNQKVDWIKEEDCPLKEG